MDYLTPKELKKMMLLSYERVERDKEEINKINVFPVPDQDTGTNLAKTLAGIRSEIQNKNFNSLNDISNAILTGAMTTAQGNAGIIYTGFLAGFFSSLGKENSVGPQQLAEYFRKGYQRARDSIQSPKKGTILDVIEATAQSFEQGVSTEKDIIILFQTAIQEAKKALVETQNQMELLKKANVVDAGGMGFLIILESYLDALDGVQEEKVKIIMDRPSEEVRRFIQTISNRYEIVALIENPKMTEKVIKEKLSRFGNSLDVVSFGNRMKVHIHTDTIEEAKEIIRSAGEIKEMRVEDMARESAGEESLRNFSIGIITDNSSNLTDKIIERYYIKVISSLSDPDDFISVCNQQLEKFKRLLIIVSSSKFNLNYQKAMEFRLKLVDPYRVYVFDSLNISSGQGLLILKAIGLIKEQREIREIIKILDKKAREIQTYLFLPLLAKVEQDNFIRSPIIKWAKRWQSIGFKPLVGLRRGQWVRISSCFRAQDASEAIFIEIKKQTKKSRQNGQKIRVVIAHKNNIEQAESLKKRLKEIKAEVSFINSIASVFDQSIVSGSLIASWDIIDGNY
ncbi:MAG: DegV family protein [Patescibacteria group bacterium]|nr:DAK2 domain-containing protein [Patescibacteria group bacterium]MBU1877231.1 DAK2 domain-containing protein [Patescibacteria group bacterium]